MTHNDRQPVSAAYHFKLSKQGGRKMRLLVFMLLAVQIVCGGMCAFAEEYYTLPEIREQAANGWHKTYTDKYGRERQVDISIDVFGDETAPVFRACWGDPLKDRFWGGDEEWGPLEEIGLAVNKRGGVENYLYEAVSGMKVNLERKYAEAYGNNLTLMEAYTILEERLLEQGIDQEYLFEQPCRFNLLYCQNKKTGEMLVPPTYYLWLWPEEYGLPILSHVAWSFRRNIYGPFESPRLSYNINSHNSYYCSTSDIEIQEILADDIPLCSVEKVTEGARSMIEEGYIYQVLSLRFGFVIYTDPDYIWNYGETVYDIPTHYFVPSWVMECYILDDPKTNKLREHPSIKELVINAQTGEMMDWFDTSLHGRGDGRYKGFI